MMAASVRIEDEAFSDGRYDVLARLAGLPDSDCARGKMMRLWRQCTIEQIYVLTDLDIQCVFGENGVDAILQSRLAERVENGIRICGTRGRIEWIKKLRNGNKNGGKKRNKKWIEWKVSSIIFKRKGKLESK